MGTNTICCCCCYYVLQLEKDPLSQDRKSNFRSGIVTACGEHYVAKQEQERKRMTATGAQLANGRRKIY